MAAFCHDLAVAFHRDTLPREAAGVEQGGDREGRRQLLRLAVDYNIHAPILLQQTAPDQRQCDPEGQHGDGQQRREVADDARGNLAEQQWPH